MKAKCSVVIVVNQCQIRSTKITQMLNTIQYSIVLTIVNALSATIAMYCESIKSGCVLGIYCEIVVSVE